MSSKSNLALALAVTCTTAIARPASAAIQTVQLVTGLSSPVFVTGAPGDLNHLYIVEKGSGTTAAIKVYDFTSHVTTTFLTLTGVVTGNEQGLLGLAFDPNYAANGNFYINYNATPTASGVQSITTIAEYHANTPLVANPTAIGKVLTFNQPPYDNHKGGWIGFSPRPGDDHNLYIATGDGGNANDQGTNHIEPGGNAQNLTTPLGKMLRININPANATYTIPANNPLVSSVLPGVRKEIFAFGLRNPYRDSFDRLTGNLMIGDVGQSAREEVDVQKASNPSGGENYGWRLREGNIQTPTVGGAPPTGYIPPIIDYERLPGGPSPLSGRTVIGGYVYRGANIPELQGTYIFGDYLGPSGGRTEVFSLKYDGTNVSNVTDLTSLLNPGATPLITNISSFGEDTAGELYIVDIVGGRIFKIAPEPASITTLLLATPLLLTRRKNRKSH